MKVETAFKNLPAALLPQEVSPYPKRAEQWGLEPCILHYSGTSKLYLSDLPAPISINSSSDNRPHSFVRLWQNEVSAAG